MAHCLLTTCAPASHVEPKNSNSEPPRALPEAEESPLRALSAEKAKVLEHHAPRYNGTGEKSEALAFLNQDLKTWLIERKQATDSLAERYETTRQSLDENKGRMALQAEAELYIDLSREFIAAATAAIPDSMKNDVDLKKAYVGAIIDAAQFSLERAQGALTGCLQPLTQPTEVPQQSCRALQSELNRIKTPTTWIEAIGSQ
jgi:hypothetical protein